MTMRMAGVEMVDRNPLEFGAEIGLHLAHPSSQTLLSPKGGSRQEIVDILRFAAPPGEFTVRADLYNWAHFLRAGCKASIVPRHKCNNYCAGFCSSRRVTLATEAAVCHANRDDRAHDHLAIRRPNARNADDLLIRSSKFAAPRIAPPERRYRLA